MRATIGRRPVGRLVLALALVATVIAAAAPVGLAASPVQRLRRVLNAGLRLAPQTSGAVVVDLTTGATLFNHLAGAPRMPASLEKLYTTSTALLRFGPTARMQTAILGVGSFTSPGVWSGALYLRGGGDPTFGSQAFDRYNYGSGATMERLVANLVQATGLTTLQGPIVGDESLFDSLRGTPPYGFAPSTDVEGLLSALAYDRGWADPQGLAFQARPALYAAQRFAAALKAAGVALPRHPQIYTAPTPAAAQVLAVVHSPKLSWLIKLTNAPSDNFFAEMLLKGIGAAFGGAGTTSAGAAIVRAEMTSAFHIAPVLEDGSGLSRSDQTSPDDVVALLRQQADDIPFTESLAVAGETGTLKTGLSRTAARGRCIGKTGTLRDVANLAGYCTATDGHRLAFAVLMNGVDPYSGHRAENRMAVAIARYNG